MSEASTYEDLGTNGLEEESSEKTGWKLLAIWTVIVVFINLAMSFIVGANTLDFKSMDMLLSYLVGNVFGLPIIVLAVSQIWKKYRNARWRVKAVLYASYLVLFSQVGSFMNMVDEVASKAN